MIWFIVVILLNVFCSCLVPLFLLSLWFDDFLGVICLDAFYLLGICWSCYLCSYAVVSIFLSPHICWYCHDDGIGRWGLWELITSWGRTLMNGIWTSLKEARERSFALSTTKDKSEKSLVSLWGSKHSLDSESAIILTLNFSASRTMKNKFLLFTYL